jgi:hypothetical protein
VSDSPLFPSPVGLVQGFTAAEEDRARRAVLLRTDLPDTDPRHLGRGETLDILAMLGLVTVPRPERPRRG